MLGKITVKGYPMSLAMTQPFLRDMALLMIKPMSQAKLLRRACDSYVSTAIIFNKFIHVTVADKIYCMILVLLAAPHLFFGQPGYIPR